MPFPGQGGFDRITAAAHRAPPAGYVHDNRWSVGLKRHIAFALLAYTLLLIFLVSHTLAEWLGGGGESMSIMPYFLLVVLVVAMIPLARRLERKWELIGRSDLSARSLGLRYRTDCIKVWAAAIGLPVLIAIIL